MRFIHAAPRQGLLAPGSKICQTLMKTCYKPYNMLGSLEFTDFAASSTKIAPKTHKYSPTGAGGFAEVLQAVTCFFLCQVKMHSCLHAGITYLFACKEDCRLQRQLCPAVSISSLLGIYSFKSKSESVV